MSYVTENTVHRYRLHTYLYVTVSYLLSNLILWQGRNMVSHLLVVPVMTFEHSDGFLGEFEKLK
jgi:hypothetical protein